MTAIDNRRVNALESSLKKFRDELKKHELWAYLIPSEDAHQSEYVAECDARRAFISGFTGSAGFVIITASEALLFTDGRYFLQASQQLSPSWTLMKMGVPGVPTKEEWLQKSLPSSGSNVVGFDETTLTVTEYDKLTELGLKLQGTSHNLVDNVWTDRPKRPDGKVIVQEEKYTGEGTASKLKRVRETAFDAPKAPDSKHDPKANPSPDALCALVITALDEIAWLFNLRGCDISFNPVFFAYALITRQEAYLFTDDSRFTPEAKKQMADLNVHIKPYNEAIVSIGDWAKQNKDETVVIDGRCSHAILNRIGRRSYRVETNPVTELKALKSDVELEGFRQCHIRDGAALTKYFAWLEQRLENNTKGPDECVAADKLEAFRAEQNLFRGPSFDTISSVGPNAAIIHYKPQPDTCATIVKDQIYLCDSGGQYFDGTTDTTRTMHFGMPTDEERDAFTRVLKGHIAIDEAVFPTGTVGYTLDVLARQYLWKGGMNYRHGTGHGVGSYLCVHEGPQGIGGRIPHKRVGIKSRMTLSNEPGYYEDGKFGIRIENIVLTVERDTPKKFGGETYLGFEAVTMVPIQKKMIKKDMLTQPEIDWLNEYHAKVRSKISPFLANDHATLQYLERETSPL